MTQPDASAAREDRRAARAAEAEAKRAAREAARAARAAEAEAKRAGPRTRNGRLCLAHEPLAALAGRVPDAVLAALLACSQGAIRKLRKQRGLVPVGDAWAEDAALVRQVVEAARASGATEALAVIGQWVEVAR